MSVGRQSLCFDTVFVLLLLVLLLSTLSLVDAVRIDRSDKDNESNNNNSNNNVSFQFLRRQLQLQEDDTSLDPTHPSDHRIQSLPLLDKLPTAMYAGHLRASPDGDKKLFYWLVAPPDMTDPHAPLVVWLNGGPGCSSMDGLFLENGPIRFARNNDKDEWKLVPNPHSWHLSPAWILYLDQPVGTGLSFTHRGNYCKNDLEVNQDFAYFLEEFLLLYRNVFLQPDQPILQRPLFMTGESHAGHYIPSMMDYILQRQQGRVGISFAGAAIGNGWIDPYHQYSATEVAYGAGLINLSQKAKLDEDEKECQRAIGRQEYEAESCFGLLAAVTDQSYGEDSNEVVCSYDTGRLEHKRSQRAFPPGHNLVERYLGDGPPQIELRSDSSDVLRALHATESRVARQIYQECADAPYYALSHQDGLGVVPELVRLLESGHRLLFYNGMNDLICNHVGTERALLGLPWKHRNDFAMAQRHVWSVQEEKNNNPTMSVYVQQFENLLYLKIPNAGHMVPLDRPVLALEMMRAFLYNHNFETNAQQLDSRPPLESSC